MQIKIGSEVLAAGGREGSSGLVIRCSHSEQVRKAVRAPKVRVFHRNNLITTVTFRVYREHVDIEAAVAFLISHASAANIAGTIEMKAGSVTKTMQGSCVVTEASHIGRSTVFDYQLTGGKLE